MKQQEKNDHWERLSAVIEQAGMSTNYFARYIGLPVAENLYRIKRGQNGISRDVAERVVEKFPQISKGWLMTGEGGMYYDEKMRSKQIPYYDKYVEEALSGRAMMPAYYIYIPMLDECDMAVKCCEEPQNILMLAKCNEENLEEGKEYLFLIKKSLSLQRWSGSKHVELGKDDKIFVVKGRLSIY